VASYTIYPEHGSLHGTFSRDYPPVLTVEPGDTVVYRTLDAGWHLEPLSDQHDRRTCFEPKDPDRDSGHCLNGPVAIRGAEPGMTLAVEIKQVRCGPWGWTCAGGWDHPVNRRFGLVEGEYSLAWSLDPDHLEGTDQLGRKIKLRPFMGVMGMPPDEPGVHSTAPPRATGGNLDCKELVQGSTLYLPIAVSGGLFSVGDGHAAQGDGEVSVTAIECPMERVELKFGLRDDLKISTPWAETPVGWITMGLHEDLNEATFRALEAMIDLMQWKYEIKKADALALASLVVDLRVTQIANGVNGVHAVLPQGAIHMPDGTRTVA
jgi:acetamidase/formamidase